MTPVRRKRLMVVAVIIVGLATAATALGLQAFKKNLLYNFTPAQVAAAVRTSASCST